MKCCTSIQRSACILAVLTCLAVLLPATEAIICYRCTVLPPQYVGEADQLCSQFDGGSRFYHDCPLSTFCMKRIIHYRLPNGTKITTAERDCASQKYTYSDYNSQERKWYIKEKIDSQAYTEGCFKGENRGAPNGPSEYCFCSSNYCNQSSLMASPMKIYNLLVIVVLIFLGSF